MYAMGKVRMTATEFRTGNGESTGHANKKATKGGGGGEMGGFVLWQKKPDLWCLELVVAGCKISAGSDGKVAWRQTPWHRSHASRGPPRPLRRTLQVPYRTTQTVPSLNLLIGINFQHRGKQPILTQNCHLQVYIPNSIIYTSGWSY